MARSRFSLSKLFKKSTIWEILFYVTLFAVALVVATNVANSYRGVKEGFESTSEFIVKKGPEIYDDFYVSIYDDLVFSKIKNDFEIGTIINETSPNDASLILDIGSGTGHHVGALNAKGFNAGGIDTSSAMVAQAQNLYPNADFQVGDAMKAMTFPPGSFTHITCLYFTIYYVKDKRRFFKNCYDWLMPGGYLVLHLVDRDNFDPILPAGDPLQIISPQKYAENRITSTVVKFDDYDYKANFEIFPNDSTAAFDEVFKNTKTGEVRKNNHKFYMPTQKDVLSKAKDVGFILLSQSDMMKCQYMSQYIYVLQRPN